MIESGADQCCLVSGESGAGKVYRIFFLFVCFCFCSYISPSPPSTQTESAKHIINQIIMLCSTEHAVAGQSIEHKILAVNPLLEAFGNAQTGLGFCLGWPTRVSLNLDRSDEQELFAVWQVHGTRL
jgi:hypothetical protein